jgi:hypothetical protein
MLGRFSIIKPVAACLSVSRVWIENVLGQLERDGRIISEGRGRATLWRTDRPELV